MRSRGFEEFWSCSHVGFNHIYKCGGTWIREHLKVMDAPCVCYANHCTHKPNSVQYPSYLFAVVRDPVDRFVSAYHEVIRRRNTNEHASIIPTDYSREQMNKVLQRLESHKTIDPHFRPQLSFLHNTAHLHYHIFKLEDYRTLIDGVQNATRKFWNHTFLNDAMRKRISIRNYINLTHEDRCRIYHIYMNDYRAFEYDAPFTCSNSNERVGNSAIHQSTAIPLSGKSRQAQFSMVRKAQIMRVHLWKIRRHSCPSVLGENTCRAQTHESSSTCIIPWSWCMHPKESGVSVHAKLYSDVRIRPATAKTTLETV